VMEDELMQLPEFKESA
ncbi:bacterioferritin-associated ferredoxin, partial [Escherichia coli]